MAQVRGQPLPDLTGKRVLIVRLSALGDVIRTLPVVLGLVKRFPTTRFFWLVERGSAGYVRAVSGIQLIEVDRQALRKGPLWRRFRTWRRLITQVRELRIQVSIDFHGVLKSGLFPWLAGIPVRVGFERGGSKEGHRWLINRRVTLTNPRVSRYERNLALARAFDGEVEVVRPDATWSPQEQRHIQEMMRDQPILLFPGTSHHGRNKRWPATSWAWLFRKLQAHGPVLFSFGPEDGHYRGELADILGSEPPSLPALTLPMLGGALLRARLLIACDTGPMHLASVLGVPLVALMGPSDPVLNRPKPGSSRMVLPEVPCAPCRNRACRLLICQDMTTPRGVLAESLELLASLATAPTPLHSTPEDGP